MANFKTHIQISAISSGVLSTSLLGANFVNSVEAVLLWIVGTLGGVLPDVDSDNSTTLNILFGIITLLSITAVLSQLGVRVSTLEIWAVIAMVYGFVNWVVRPIFESYTVHRGIFHSLLAAVFLSVLSIVVAYEFTFLNTTMSWLVGFFIFIGYVTHLVLDELYSVDFSNVRVKRSFGTACKLYEYKNIQISLTMLLMAGGLFFIAPNTQGVKNTLLSKHTFVQIKDSFLPLALKS
ncbi:hypothetical protein A9Q99_22715 [Gammaproteobacteria bacterium 45_16_T64]|nr:hypothetical protein A9Q99_22715 [Gammaproteobacteria bacterium 45_16_T64]